MRVLRNALGDGGGGMGKRKGARTRPPRAIGLAAIVIAASSGAVISVVGSPPATADTPLQWSLQASNPDSGIRTFSSVTCPTASHCEAIGGLDNYPTIGGLILSSDDGGATWSEQYSVAPRQQLIGITCATSSDCIAVGNDTVVTTTDGGATWTGQSIPGYEILDTVTCTSALDCVAGGQAEISVSGGSFPLLTTTDGGTTWTGDFVSSDDGEFSGISCPTSSECVAVGMSAPQGLGAEAISEDGGNTWQDVPLPTGTPWLKGVSCATASDCVAVGYGNTAGTILSSTDGGFDWTTEAIPAAVTYLQSVTCSDSSNCVAVGGTSSASGIALTSTDGGTTWVESSLSQTVPELETVTCDGSDCVAGGFPLATSLVSTDGGVTWTATPFSQGVSPATSITCTDVLDCVTAPYLDQITPGAITPSLNEGAASAVSCPTTTDCVGIGYDAEVSTDGGATWTDQSTAPLTAGLGALSCATVSDCVAVGGIAGPDGPEAVMTSTSDGGVTWNSETPPSDLADLTAVSCTTVSDCVAVGFSIDNPSGATVDEARSIETTDGGTTWTEETISTAGSVSGLSCPTTSFCVTAGPYGGVSATDNGGLTWNTETFSNIYQLTSVSCATASNCVAVGGSQGMGTDNGGQTWTPEALPGAIKDLTSVSCPTPSICMATGTSPAGGMALIGSGSVGPDQPSITSADNLTVQTGVPFSLTITTSATVATSGPKTTNESTAPWITASNDGDEPATLVDKGDGTATLSGDPSVGGVYVFTLAVSDGPGNAGYQQFALTVNQPPSFTSGLGGDVLPGQSLSEIATTAAYPTPAITEQGVLPAGISFFDNGNGTADLSGSPEPGSEGTYSITLVATNSVGQSQATYTFVVLTPAAITSADSATAFVGAPFSFTVTGAGEYPLTFSDGGSLPSGLGFEDNNDGTATIAGTPAEGTAGTYPITINLKDVDEAVAQQSFTLTVAGITSADTASALVGTPFTFGVTTVGTGQWTLSNTGTLPSGVTFQDNGDGTATIAGTPAALTAGTYPITIDAQDTDGPLETQTFTLFVVDIAMTSTTLPPARVRAAYDQRLRASGGRTPYRWTLESGKLPPRITLSGDGRLTGTAPKKAALGSYTFTVTITDSTSKKNGGPFRVEQTLTLDLDS
jgi:large repetitive protein